MHLALCTQQFGNYWSGLGAYATILAKGLVNRGVTLTIISPGEPLPEIEADFIQVKPAGWDPTHGGWFSLAGAYRRELKQVKADIVHFTDARESYGYRGEIPAVGTLHDDYFARHRWVPWAYRRHYVDWLKRYAYYSFVTLTERRALCRLQALIANSDSTAETIIRRYAIDPDRVLTIYIQPDLESEPLETGLEQGRLEKPTLLFVGGNIQRKGLPLVLQALQQLENKFPDLSLRILGKNQNLEKMKRLVNSMGLADRVYFEGWVPPTELSLYYRNAAIFIMPSLMEGYGLVYLEAMSQGLPVIAGNVGGSRELIKHEQNGLLVDPLQVEDLVRSIEVLLTDLKLREKVIQGGFETILGLDPESMITETYRYYSQLLAANKNTVPGQ